MSKEQTTLGIRNNNPLNIRFSTKKIGEDKQEKTKVSAFSRMNPTDSVRPIN